MKITSKSQGGGVKTIPDYARIHRILAKDSHTQESTALKTNGKFTKHSTETVTHLLEMYTALNPWKHPPEKI